MPFQIFTQQCIAQCHENRIFICRDSGGEGEGGVGDGQVTDPNRAFRDQSGPGDALIC